MRSVTVGRPMPLKKPNTAHKATLKGPPIMRGTQYISARRSISAGSPKGPKIFAPASASKANTGTVNSEAHNAVQVACDARAYRRAP